MCKGSTADSDSVCEGSNPSPAATKALGNSRGLFLFALFAVGGIRSLTAFKSPAQPSALAPRVRILLPLPQKALGNSWVYVRQYCAKIDEAARNRMELIVRSLAEQNGVTEQLKDENQMEWVRQMNACKAQAEEVVKAELIYN